MNSRESRRPNRIMFTTAALCLLILNGDLSAEEAAFNPGATIQEVAAILARSHIAPKPVDDELSKLWLRSFVNHLDPHRMYFLAEDLRDFQRFELQLDDQAKAGNFQFAKLVQQRFRTRVDEAIATAKQQLSIHHDYTLHERYTPHLEEYAVNREELRERWRLRLKAEMLIEKLHGRRLFDVKSQLLGRYQRILRQTREMSDERLCNFYLNALTTIYDRQSTYSSHKLFSGTIMRHLRTYRLGLQLGQSNGDLIIVGAIPTRQNESTRKNLIGWNVIAISRLDGTVIDLVEMNLDEVLDIIRGPFGPLKDDTDIILELLHADTGRRVSMSWNRLPS